VLRWHGGKWKIAAWVIAHFPPHRIYVEPFGGAFSVCMRKPRTYAEVYNDLDQEAFNLFRVLQDPAHAARLIELLMLTPFAREEFDAANSETEEPVERARNLIVRSFMGFGSNAYSSSPVAKKTGFRSYSRAQDGLGRFQSGTRANPKAGPACAVEGEARVSGAGKTRGNYRSTGFRSNSDRSGTTPAHDWANYPEALAAIVERLRGVVIENRDACEVMAQHDSPETLHYVDPPYLPETRAPSNKYDLKHRMYRHELTREDHVRLLEYLRGLKGMVALSGYASPLYDDALADWKRDEMLTHADGARERTEVLWLNPACAAALDRQHQGAHTPLFAREAAE
jgi:DNA adenine methylase